MSKLHIETAISAAGLIVQTVESDSVYKVRDLFMKQCIDTMDSQIRAALILMGWTPPSSQTTRLNKDKTAVIDTGYFWIPITDQTPRGTKMQLINKAAGAHTSGVLGTNEQFFDHWAPLPTFMKD